MRALEDFWPDLFDMKWDMPAELFRFNDAGPVHRSSGGRAHRKWKRARASGRR